MFQFNRFNNEQAITLEQCCATATAIAFLILPISELKAILQQPFALLRQKERKTGTISIDIAIKTIFSEYISLFPRKVMMLMNH